MPKERSTRTVADVKADLLASGLTREQQRGAAKETQELSTAEQISRLQVELQKLQAKQAQEPTQGEQGQAGSSAQFSSMRGGQATPDPEEKAQSESKPFDSAQSKPASGQASKPSTQSKG